MPAFSGTNPWDRFTWPAPKPWEQPPGAPPSGGFDPNRRFDLGGGYPQPPGGSYPQPPGGEPMRPGGDRYSDRYPRPPGGGYPPNSPYYGGGSRVAMGYGGGAAGPPPNYFRRPSSPTFGQPPTEEEMMGTPQAPPPAPIDDPTSDIITSVMGVPPTSNAGGSFPQPDDMRPQRMPGRRWGDWRGGQNKPSNQFGGMYNNPQMNPNRQQRWQQDWGNQSIRPLGGFGSRRY